MGLTALFCFCSIITKMPWREKSRLARPALKKRGRVWSYVSKLPHDGTILGRLEVYLKHSDARIDEYANYIVRQLDTPLSNNTSILVKAVTLDRSFIVNEGESVVDFDRSIIQILGTNAFAVIPLVVRNIRIGVIVADNVITRNPIKPEDVQMLDILATQAALAIAHANSLEELARKFRRRSMLMLNCGGVRKN